MPTLICLFLYSGKYAGCNICRGEVDSYVATEQVLKFRMIIKVNDTLIYRLGGVIVFFTLVWIFLVTMNGFTS